MHKAFFFWIRVVGIDITAYFPFSQWLEEVCMSQLALTSNADPWLGAKLVLSLGAEVLFLPFWPKEQQFGVSAWWGQATEVERNRPLWQVRYQVPFYQVLLADLRGFFCSGTAAHPDNSCFKGSGWYLNWTSLVLLQLSVQCGLLPVVAGPKATNTAVVLTWSMK